jgi:hypothetical protein
MTPSLWDPKSSALEAGDDRTSLAVTKQILPQPG